MLPAGALLRGYDRSWLSGDVLAGLGAGAVVIPQAMAYGTVAGLPVQVGLYTCIVPTVAYALVGGARRMSVTTTSTIVALTGLALVSAGVPADDPAALIGAATTLTLLVGLALLLARVLRLGFLVETVSEPVLAGLKVGVGLTIAVSQLPTLLGIPDIGDGFFADVGNAVRHLMDANLPTVVISVATIIGLLVLRRWLPRVPGPLIALVGGIAAVVALDLGDRGVALIPEVPRGLPVPSVPPLEHVGALAPYAVAIALMSYLESASVARMTRHPDDPPVSNNGELVAVGVAATAGSFFQALPPAGGFSQTMVNAAAGARTQMSELVTAALAVLTALLFAPAFADLPQATLAAVVLLAVSGLLGPGELYRIARISRLELAVALVTGAIALVTNLLVGVLAGVLLTFYLVLRALNHPKVVELGADGPDLVPDGEPVPGLLALRIEGGLYTANVRSVQDVILGRAEAADPRPAVVLVDMRGVADLSVTVMDAFHDTAGRLARRDMGIWFAALPTRALAKARRTQVWSEAVEAGRVHATLRAALAAFRERFPDAATPVAPDGSRGAT